MRTFKLFALVFVTLQTVSCASLSDKNNQQYQLDALREQTTVNLADAAAAKSVAGAAANQASLAKTTIERSSVYKNTVSPLGHKRYHHRHHHKGGKRQHRHRK